MISGSSTLPRTTTRTADATGTTAGGVGGAVGASGEKVAAATSSTSLYDNVTGSAPPVPPSATAHQGTLKGISFNN